MQKKLSIIFSGSDQINNTNFVMGLQEKLGMSFPISGGSIPNNLNQKRSPISFNQELLRDAAWGILWSGKINFNLITKHSWQPLGKPRYVTKAERNIVNEIDEAPAVNLYKEYFSKNTAEIGRDIKRLSAFYPLGIRTEEKNEFLLRSATSIKPDGSLVFSGDVPQGSSIRLMISSKQACLNTAKEVAQSILKNAAGKKIRFALILNSLSRFTVLGRSANQEIKIIKNTIGEDIPMAGIFTSAEDAPLNTINYLGRTYIHNNSLAILTMFS